MNEELERIIEALESIGLELERLRLLREHELGVRVEMAPDGHGPYVPRTGDEE